MTREQDIVHENASFWVLRDRSRMQYTVFRTGLTHSTSDCAFSLDEDGLACAKARVDYLAQLTQGGKHATARHAG